MLEDHSKLYKSLAKNKVHYLLIGGAAVIMYGVSVGTLLIYLTSFINMLHL